MEPDYCNYKIYVYFYQRTDSIEQTASYDDDGFLPNQKFALLWNTKQVTGRYPDS